MLELWHSTIGKKVFVAVTGTILIAYLILHMAGNLLSLAGPWMVFALNALSVVGVAWVLWRWRPAPSIQRLPPEHFFSAELRVGGEQGRKGLHGAVWFHVTDLAFPAQASGLRRARADNHRPSEQLVLNFGTAPVNQRDLLSAAHAPLEPDDELPFGG